MNNLIISLKRFFGNKNTITIICVLAIVLILYFAYNYRIKQATEPLRVPYARQEIQPREQITEDMIGYVEIPKKMITSNTVTNINNIIGMFANYNTVIPSGSLFYQSTLVTWEQMPDSAWADIPDKYTVVSLNVNTETTYGNSIFPGNYIDLYYAAHDSTGKLLLGMHLLLRKAGYLSGEIIPVPRNASYSDNPGATIVSSEYIEDFILSQTVILPEQGGSSNGGNNGRPGTVN